ncbi:hypothetical protein FHG87_010636 [Trinorchestia longiramus]|nr:hypothetical protein FHG87_010636 [Trinorchestia longiramus]
MFSTNVMAWNGGDLEKLEVVQNRVGRLALSAPKWTAAEALRGDLGWSLLSERMVKAVLNYKVRIERMENKRWVKRIFEWNLSESLLLRLVVATLRYFLTQLRLPLFGLVVRQRGST